MSNQPKITYRSDTTGFTYQMMQHNKAYTIQAVNFDGVCVAESPQYPYIYPWMKTIHDFFDVCNVHINDRVWRANA